MGLATLPGLGDGNGESPRTAEPLLGVCRVIKLCVDKQVGFQRASEALGTTLISITLLSGTYLHFFGGGLSGGFFSARGGFGRGGGEALGALGLQVAEAAQIFFPQGQQLLQVLQAVLGAGVHPRPVALLLQVVQAGVHAAGAFVFL